MIKRGPHRKHTASFQERLARFSRQMRERALALPPGEGRTALKQKLEQTQRAVRMTEWLNSSNPKAPPPLRDAELLDGEL
jgi:hypothetical protein